MVRPASAGREGALRCHLLIAIFSPGRPAARAVQTSHSCTVILAKAGGSFDTVILANAGISFDTVILANAGISDCWRYAEKGIYSNDGKRVEVPAFAGMTSAFAGMTSTFEGMKSTFAGMTVAKPAIQASLASKLQQRVRLNPKTLSQLL